jgi:hypothetical protein
LDEPQFHQRAGGVVDEDERGAGIASILKPAMIRPVDLDQFAKAFPAQARLVEGPALFARQPDTIFLHPFAQCLTRHFEPVVLVKHLGRQCRPELLNQSI